MKLLTAKDYLFSHIKKLLGPGRIPLSYNLTLNARHGDGVLFDTRYVHNMIMDAGEDEVAKLIGGITASAFTYVAMGTDNTAPADSQTALIAEISTNGGSRAADSSPTSSGNVLTINYLFTITGALAIVEAGLLNESSGGDMLARQIFDVINLTADDTIEIIWEITAGTAR